MTGAITVKFNDVEEFVEELGKWKPLAMAVEPVVRLTRSYKDSSFTPMIKHVTVLGTHLLRTKENTHLILKLERYVGEVCPHAEPKAEERAEKVMADLERGVKELGMEVRAGVYE